ncbi:MAG: SGNH/GDSL hydrolase family protein [Candidatus Krumholzibacteria bacterium]|nr:SGNH/GDSL hydrolase family protein [Candidatus Krumholzibacteria bacterium]
MLDDDLRRQRGHRSRWARLGANFLLAATTLAALILAAEIVTRRFFPVENVGTVIRFDPELGWSLDPGSRVHVVDRRRGIDYRVRVNALGMREREVAEPRPGRPRVLHIGDSVAFGAGVDVQWRCSDFMARALGGTAEVLNTAVPGFGTDQEFLLLQRVAPRLRPDIVVLDFFMINDVINNGLDHLFLGTAPKPRFAVEGDSLVLAAPVRRPGAPPARRAAHGLRNLLRRSHFLVMLVRSLKSVTGAEAPAQDAFPLGFGRNAGGASVTHWSVFESPSDEGMESAWRTTEAILLRVKQYCDSIGAELIVFVFPLIEADDDWRRWLLEGAGVAPDRLDFHAPFVRLGRFCGGGGIDYVYPLAEFRDAARRRKLYLERDGHPNAYGHALAARVLLDHLRARYGLDYQLSNADLAFLD